MGFEFPKSVAPGEYAVTRGAPKDGDDQKVSES